MNYLLILPSFAIGNKKDADPGTARAPRAVRGAGGRCERRFSQIKKKICVHLRISASQSLAQLGSLPRSDKFH
jgi:hypothetical protein